MAKLVFSSQLTETEVQHCNTIINRHTHVTPECIVWKGTKDKDGYRETHLQFRGKRVKVRVHCLSKQIVRTYRNYTFRICVTKKRALPLNTCLLNLLELIIREKAVF